MKNRFAIFFAVFLAMVVGGGLLLAASSGGNKALQHTTGQETDHDDDGHEANDSGKHENDSAIHGEDEHDRHAEEGSEGKHDAHGDESDVIEMTREQQEEIGLVIAVARAGDIEHPLSLVGEVRLHEDRLAHLVPKVAGTVRSVSVSLGDKVREGQTLAIIDSTEFAQMKTDYLEKLRHLELTRRTFERKQYLMQENIASEADWLEAQAAFQNAETQLLSAKRRLIFLGLNAEEIDALPSAGDGAFGSYRLQSPLAGTIIAKHITRGEKVGAEEIFTVADLSVVWVDLQIPAQNLGMVKTGQPVEISSTEGRTAEGRLSMVGPVVDRESRTALGRLELPNPDGFWKPGLFVKGLILGQTTASAVVIPSTAVQNIDAESVVFVPDGHGFVARDVSLGRSGAGRTEILTGLKAGEPYVSKGAFTLKGVKVTSGLGGHAGHGH